VLTGGLRPPDRILSELQGAGVFAYLVGSDTYRTAQAVDEILVKTHSADTEKISTIIELVDGALDVGALLREL
jgi:BioD-like phosphotransacetylase family protein